MTARLIDANANRAAEGLRVLEDIARFLLVAGPLAARAKELRHALRTAVPAATVLARDTTGDPGIGGGLPDEARRDGPVALIRANAARAAEALRVLEEAAKLPGAAVGGGLDVLRYRLYDLERDLLARLPAWRLRGIRLLVIVDPAIGADPVAVAVAAAAGGAGIIQLRAKSLAVRPYRKLAARLRDALPSTLFIVNDDAAVAVAVGADGVHVGQEDLDPVDARRVLGPGRLVGASVHHPAQLAAAQAAGADYVGLGPMRATATKPHEPRVGPALLDAVRHDLAVPSYAIGGIDEDWLREHARVIPHGIAVCGCVGRAADPQAVCERLRHLLDDR
jgi:thiamine-phosphate pyrophosphorylase